MTNSSGNPPPNLAEVIGRNVRRIRLLEVGRQEDLAKKAAEWGLPWTQATVHTVETGKRTPDLSELVLLAMALGKTLSELLMDNDPGQVEAVQLTEGAVLPLQLFRSAVQDPSDQATRTQIQGYLKEPEHWVDSAEKKVPERLGVDEDEVQRLSNRLWKTTLLEERNRRIAEEDRRGSSGKSLRARRGLVTRQLDRELRKELVKTATDARIWVPSSRAFNDDFYEQVARVYTDVARNDRHPERLIADVNNLRVSRVRRWVATAREKGFLPTDATGKER